MPKDLIVPLDGSAFADAILPHAMEVARLTRTRIVLLRVHQPVAAYFGGGEPPIVAPSAEWDAETERGEREWLAGKTRAVDRIADVPVTSEFRVGPAADEIVAAAAERDTYAVMLTTHGSGGWAPEWLGSVTDAVVRRAEVPVLAYSQAATGRAPGGKSMLVLLDGTVESEAVLPEATLLARSMGEEITLVRIVPPEWTGDALMLMPTRNVDPLGVDGFAADAKKSLETTAMQVRKAGLSVRSVVISDANTVRAILREIEESNPDFVAVATSSRGMSRLFLRSVADKVLRAGGRPTLLLHRNAAPKPKSVPVTPGLARRRRGRPTRIK